MRDDVLLMFIGRSFHSLGPYKANARAPYVTVRGLTDGSWRRCFDEERRVRVGIYGLIKHVRYDGPRPWKHLNTRSRILYFIR